MIGGRTIPSPFWTVVDAAQASRQELEDAWQDGRRLRAPAIALADELGLNGLHLTARIRRTLSLWPATLQLLTLTARLPLLVVNLPRNDSSLLIRTSFRESRGAGVLRGLGRSAYLVPSSGLAFVGRAGRGRRTYVRRGYERGLKIVEVDLSGLNLALAQMDYAPMPCQRCASRSFVAYDLQAQAVAMTHIHLAPPIAELHVTVHTDQNWFTGPGRYALFEAAVRQLAIDNVRILILFDNFFTTSPGLREFERNLDFIPINLLLRSRGHRPRRRIIRYRGRAADQSAQTD